MSSFVNYSIKHGLTITSSRNPQAELCNIGELLEAVTNDTLQELCCGVDERTLNTLKRPDYLSNYNYSAHSLSLLYKTIHLHLGA